MIALENVRYSIIVLLILLIILVKAEGSQSQVLSSTAALPKDFAPVKAIVVGLEALPLYPVDDPNAAVAAVAVRRDRQTLSMLDEQGHILWSKDLGLDEIWGDSTSIKMAGLISGSLVRSVWITSGAAFIPCTTAG